MSCPEYHKHMTHDRVIINLKFYEEVIKNSAKGSELEVSAQIQAFTLRQVLGEETE